MIILRAYESKIEFGALPYKLYNCLPLSRYRVSTLKPMSQKTLTDGENPGEV